EEYLEQHPISPDRGSALGRVLLERRVVHISDVLADPEYAWQGQRITGNRSVLAVPLLREENLVGAITVMRKVPQPSTARQIDRGTTLADQAVIAIENVRLFDEVQARSRELSESLEQQTATAEVLKVISRSAFDLRVVLHTLIESAARLCEADMGYIGRPKGDGSFRHEAMYGGSPALWEYIDPTPLRAGRGRAGGRAALVRTPLYT